MKRIFVVAFAISVAMVIRAVEFPNPADFNPSWESAKPGTSYSTDLPTAALLGNGALGAVNGGDGNHKKFVLTRGDLWSCGDFTYGKNENNIGPISFADFVIGPGMRTVASTDTLDLPTATLVTEGKFGKGKVRLESYVAAVIDMFKKWQLRPLMQKNFHLHDNVHGVEKLGAMEFIQSMFIQCDHGIVKVFPNWTGVDAKFENLRAKGCFLVSAEMKNGKVVRVSVKSEKGGRFRLVDPSGRDMRPACPPSGWTRGKTRNSGEPTLERDFKPGETVELFGLTS